VCTGCAVTASFVWKTKYFYDESNLEEFRGVYNEMPLYRKIFENKLLAAGLLVVLGVFLFTMLVAVVGLV
jgi:restriction endonuclease Mrr